MKEVDPVLVSVFARAFKSLTDEMSICLQKTTRSPILCEAKDFVTGLYDSRGNMLEQTENLPILSFSLGPVCKYIIDYFGDEIYPGDVIFHNDVFSMGNQNNDVAVYKPIFFEEKLVAWAACKGHQADIGGAVAGGYNPDATEVWQEALRIPPVKIYERGKFRKDVWDLIFANIRFKIVQEDMRAEIGSCVVGERGMLKLLEKYGIECLEAHKEALFKASRKIMESEIASIPNGEYRGESTVYYDGKNKGKHYKIRVKITVRDRSIRFDYSDTDQQTNGFVNGTYTSSASAAVLTFLQMVNPDIPHNQGMLEPIEIIIPEGTILNAAYPAATTYGNHLCPANADAIIRALAPVVPERVTAGWNHLLCSLTTGVDERKKDKFVDICFMGLKGGSGALKGVDGYDHIGMIDASGGLLDQDYEMFEQQTPHLLRRHEYLCDSAGAGQWRGGLGVETVFEIGSDNTQLVVFGDGDVEPAFGLDGGGTSSLNSITLTYPEGKKHSPLSLDLLKGVPKGTIYHQLAGGGGGYGKPVKRPAQTVARELRDELISPQSARDIYGVEVDCKTFKVDEAATLLLRKLAEAASEKAAPEKAASEKAASEKAAPEKAGDMESKRFEILSNIMRASHFEWRRAVLNLYPDTDPKDLVKRYWAEVGKDTAKFYLKKIDTKGDLAQQFAELYVGSSVAMGEDAEVLSSDKSSKVMPDLSACSLARHNDCPWYHWHKREKLLEEDQPGCDQWLQTVIDEINKELGSTLRFETLESLPEGGACCLRKFWEENK